MKVIIWLRKWCILIALSETSGSVMRFGRSVSRRGAPAERPGYVNTQLGHINRQPLEKGIAADTFNGIYFPKHLTKRELSQENRERHNDTSKKPHHRSRNNGSTKLRKSHHKKKHHQCKHPHHKKSSKVHKIHQKDEKIPIMTTPFNLFGNPTMTPMSIAGSGEFLIIGRSGNLASWDVNTDREQHTSTEKPTSISTIPEDIDEATTEATSTVQAITDETERIPPKPVVEITQTSDGANAIINLLEPLDPRDKLKVEIKGPDDIWHEINPTDDNKIPLDGVEVIRISAQDDQGKQSEPTDYPVSKLPGPERIPPKPVVEITQTSDGANAIINLLEPLDPRDKLKVEIKGPDGIWHEINPTDDNKIPLDGVEVIRISAQDDQGKQSEPTDYPVSKLPGPVRIPPKPVVNITQTSDGANAIINLLEPLDPRDKLKVEIKGPDDIWHEINPTDDNKIPLDGVEVIRISAQDDQGKQSEPTDYPVSELPGPDTIKCPEMQVPKCIPQYCMFSSCVDKASTCQGSIEDCLGELDSQVCDCDNTQDYIWTFPPHSFNDPNNKCIQQSECVNCEGGKEYNCEKCSDDTCEIAWDKTKYCTLSTHSCTEMPHCNCDSEKGLFWDEIENECVNKTICADRIECETTASYPRCNISTCDAVTCDAHLLNGCDNLGSDDLENCDTRPICMCQDNYYADIRGGENLCFTDCTPKKECLDNYEISKCNINKCTERTLEDITNNVPYDHCEFTTPGYCKGNSICICNSKRIRVSKQNDTCIKLRDAMAELHICGDSMSINVNGLCETEDCMPATCEMDLKDNFQKCTSRDFQDSPEAHTNFYECTNEKLFCACIDGGDALIWNATKGKCVAKRDECRKPPNT